VQLLSSKHWRNGAIGILHHIGRAAVTPYFLSQVKKQSDPEPFLGESLSAGSDLFREPVATGTNTSYDTESLASDSDIVKYLTALGALKALGEHIIIEPLLNRDEYQLRKDAEEALLDRLIEALDHKEFRLREEGEETLKDLCRTDMAGAFLQRALVYVDGREEVGETIVRGLKILGNSAQTEPGLSLFLLALDKGAYRYSLNELVASWDGIKLNDSFLEELLKRIQNRDTKYGTCDILSGFGVALAQDKFIAAIARSLNNSDFEVKWGAENALKKLKPFAHTQEYQTCFETLLDKPDWEKWYPKLVLEHIGEAAATPRFIHELPGLLASSDIDLRSEALRITIKMKSLTDTPQIQESLKQLFAVGQPGAASDVVRAMTTLGCSIPMHVIDDVLQALSNPEGWQQCAAIEAARSLGNSVTPEILSIVLELVDKGHDLDTCLEAAECVERSGNAGQIPGILDRLPSMLKDSRSYVSDCAIGIVSQLDIDAATPEVIEAISEVLLGTKGMSLLHRRMGEVFATIGVSSETPSFVSRFARLMGSNCFSRGMVKAIEAQNNNDTRLRWLHRLIDLLEHENQEPHWIASGARETLEELEKIAAEPEICERLTELLSHDDHEVRERCSTLLHRFRSLRPTPKMMKTLSKALVDGRTVHHAARVAVRWADTPISSNRLEWLRDLLQHRDKGVSSTASDAICSIAEWPASIPEFAGHVARLLYLDKGLFSKTWEPLPVDVLARDILKDLGRKAFAKSVLKSIEKTLCCRNPLVRLQAKYVAENLDKSLENGRFILPFVKLFQCKDQIVKQEVEWAIDVLCKNGTKIVNHVLQPAHSKSGNVQWISAKVIASHIACDVAPGLLHELIDVSGVDEKGDNSSRQYIVDMLEKLLSESNEKVQIAALEAVTRIGSAIAMDQHLDSKKLATRVWRLFSSREQERRQAAINALSSMELEKALPAMRYYLNTLAECGDRASTGKAEALKQMMSQGQRVYTKGSYWKVLFMQSKYTTENVRPENS